MRIVSPAIVLFCFSSLASAQMVRDRAGTWEAGFLIADMTAESLSGENGAKLEVGNDVAWGFTGGYNFTNRLAVLADWTWSNPSYDATRIREDTGQPDTISASLDINTLHIKGVFYFLDGALTPFVEAGVGWTYVDSNIVDGPPTTGCWWDPWWGYVCRSFFDTYSETRTSYSTAVGIRWDLRNEMSLRGSYGVLEVDTSSATEDASLDTFRIDLSWRF